MVLFLWVNSSMKLQSQIRWWMIVASVIPCSFLIVIGICHFTGWGFLQNKAIVASVGFIAVMMSTWWWWAMATLQSMTKDRSNSVEVMQRWFNIRNQKLDRLEREVQTLRETLKKTVEDAR